MVVLMLTDDLEPSRYWRDEIYLYLGGLYKSKNYFKKGISTYYVINVIAPGIIEYESVIRHAYCHLSHSKCDIQTALNNRISITKEVLKVLREIVSIGNAKSHPLRKGVFYSTLAKLTDWTPEKE